MAKDKVKMAVVGQELNGIFSRAQDNTISPMDVVSWAKENRDSATYRWFEKQGCFDPEKAMLRLQAICGRWLIRRVTVTVMKEDGNAIVLGSGTSLEMLRGKGLPSYVSTPTIMSNQAMMDGLRRQALKSLRLFLLSFGHIADFTDVAKAIRNVEKKLLEKVGTALDAIDSKEEAKEKALAASA